jgi:hypothetical protein
MTLLLLAEMRSRLLVHLLNAKPQIEAQIYSVFISKKAAQKNNALLIHGKNKSAVKCQRIVIFLMDYSCLSRIFKF